MICLGAAVTFLPSGSISAQTAPYQSSSDFAKYAMKLRESALQRMESQVVIQTSSRPLSVSGRYPWKTGIVTTVFWIGSAAKETAGNSASAWDEKWQQSYGGYDNPNPSARRNFLPANFVPRQNPFYIALPYNDIGKGVTKPEARQVIPWFKEAFAEEGKSVCRDRWVAIRNSTGKVCYAQWSDCGPFRTDHWQYVFGNEKPKPNANQGSGLNVSPGVRDYLGLGGTDVTDWKFVDFKDVPNGPWSTHGDNNDFVQVTRRKVDRAVESAPQPRSTPSPTDPPSVKLN